jgi:aspartate aminotransferase
VQVTVGTKHALHLALGAVAGHGDEVLVLRPSWPGHAGAVESVGASVVEVPVERDGLVNPDVLEQVGTAHTGAIVIANPSNPSGVLHPPALIADIADWCRRNGIWLISDEVYGGLVYDSNLSATEVVTDSTRLIVVDRVSKVHAMTGWRVGWLIGLSAVVDAARRQVSATITHVPALTQRGALAALEVPASADTLAGYRAARDLLVDRLQSVPGIVCPTPAGGMFAFPDVSRLLGDGRAATAAELAAQLLDQAHVAVVPGEVFAAEGHLRISFAVGHDRLAQAADRLVIALTDGST